MEYVDNVGVLKPANITGCGNRLSIRRQVNSNRIERRWSVCKIARALECSNGISTLTARPGPGWPEIALLAAALAIAFPTAFSARWQLTALRFGEDQGEELRRFRCTAALRRSSSGQPLGRARGRLRADDRLHRPGRPPHIARLLLDEPTSALDPRHQIDVMEAVREIAQAEMESTDQLVTGWARSSQFVSAEFDAGARNPRQT